MKTKDKEYKMTEIAMAAIMLSMRRLLSLLGTKAIFSVFVNSNILCETCMRRDGSHFLFILDLNLPFPTCSYYYSQTATYMAVVSMKFSNG